MKGTIIISICFFMLLPFVFSQKNASDIIRSYGYTTEEHWVPTLDGYFLLMNRIFPKGQFKGVVLFQHGVLDSSIGICLEPKSEGLPWLLSDLGYEVWMGNNRGNGCSMRHVKYSVKDPEFWDFSWEDMAEYDFPAMINYALSVSGASKLAYMGHSEGTAQAFAGFIAHPDIAKKVSLFAAMAPVAYIGHSGSLVLQFLASIDLDRTFEMFGVREFNLPAIVEKYLPGICDKIPGSCYFILETLMGPSTEMNLTRLPYILSYEPFPTSVKNLAHWAQGIRSKTFSKFDYGVLENLQRYGSVNPPAYKFSDFPKDLNVALFTGSNDYLGDPTDVKRMISEFPSTPLVFESDYGHMDFLWAINVKTRVYNSIISLLDNFQKP